MKISARRHDKTTIFDFSGDIDFANSPVVRDSVLREIRESRTPRVLVNLSQVRYMDSSGVASLVEGLKASRDLGSRARCCRVRRRCPYCATGSGLCSIGSARLTSPRISFDEPT